MGSSPGTERATGAQRPEVFSRVVVGVDGTEPGFEACRQARRLVEPDGWIELVAAAHLADATLAGWSASQFAEELEREAADALERAREIVGERAETRLVNGDPSEVLRDELERRQATVVALGTHGHSRVSEIMLGGVSGELLHLAPCSILIARAPHVDDGPFPSSLVVGIDGSTESFAALQVAEQLARRLDAPLRAVIALDDDSIDLDAARALTPSLEELDGQPVPVLARVAENADILLVGSRGLSGLRALGSVSERVAHEAPASVLVVRGRGA
jgi:Universal stress protein UspA and related nucleotide-binding proteins